MPEETIPESKYSTGGEIEHEISTRFKVLMQVLQHILVDLYDRRDSPFYYAWQANCEHFGPTVPVVSM